LLPVLIESMDPIVAERNGRYATISWSFTKEKAREKFPTLYTEN